MAHKSLYLASTTQKQLNQLTGSGYPDVQLWVRFSAKNRGKQTVQQGHRRFQSNQASHSGKEKSRVMPVDNCGLQQTQLCRIYDSKKNLSLRSQRENILCKQAREGH